MAEYELYELQHTGVLGMHWGVRLKQAKVPWKVKRTIKKRASDLMTSFKKDLDVIMKTKYPDLDTTTEQYKNDKRRVDAALKKSQKTMIDKSMKMYIEKGADFLKEWEQNPI